MQQVGVDFGNHLVVVVNFLVVVDNGALHNHHGTFLLFFSCHLLSRLTLGVTSAA